MVNELSEESTEVELEKLLVECSDLRASLEKSISEILEYAKVFEDQEMDEALKEKNSKKGIEI